MWSTCMGLCQYLVSIVHIISHGCQEANFSFIVSLGISIYMVSGSAWYSKVDWM